MKVKEWTYQNKLFSSIENFPKGVIGFIYKLIDSTTGKFYIGRKVLYFKKKRKIGKKEKALMAGKGRKPNYEKIIKESDWKEYLGSCEYFKKMKEQDQEHIIRQIIQFCYTKKHLTYCELKWLFNSNVLEDSNSINENIQGKFFRKDLIF